MKRFLIELLKLVGLLALITCFVVQSGVILGALIDLINKWETYDNKIQLSKCCTLVFGTMFTMVLYPYVIKFYLKEWIKGIDRIMVEEKKKEDLPVEDKGNSEKEEKPE